MFVAFDEGEMVSQRSDRLLGFCSGRRIEIHPPGAVPDHPQALTLYGCGWEGSEWDVPERTAISMVDVPGQVAIGVPNSWVNGDTVAGPEVLGKGTESLAVVGFGDGVVGRQGEEGEQRHGCQPA